MEYFHVLVCELKSSFIQTRDDGEKTNQEFYFVDVFFESTVISDNIMQKLRYLFC